ncbi:hypothetical protein ANANG_G00203290 [Anguilla anguilla]|uniref:Uncharacterized protein n=1 Tax=Anguilla anguilla TaxID=7936 RepID=A0A9D3M5T9_ANGAN|nr:hypothetical protein ANANG_G00203290 [Anguilla anguilla]
MEAQGGAATPVEPSKDIQNLLKPSSSGDLPTAPSHNPSAEEESGITVPISGLLQVTERRLPHSTVSGLQTAS